MRINVVLFSAAVVVAGHNTRAAEPGLLPAVPPGFTVQLYAREPLIRNPCAMAFDHRGRLFVGHGPQYRHPKPDTPPDTIEILLDDDGDGIADRTKTFARGLNCVQGLAWHGRDLWVANAPDLTIVRDLDGDDEADEYVRVYTDLGNIEHALHGLNWAPDGKLYMGKGTSKGLTQPGRIAPKPFRDLWGVTAPPGAPDLPEPPRVFKKGEYKSAYHDSGDDWGKEGGVLRCDDMGANLEIVSRGLRNPWGLAHDHGFNWLSTDNDQYDGDRIVMPFYGAHFGWSHTWSANWTGAGHLPTVPVSGPVFPGSGTGKIYVDLPTFPAAYRGVWFINDWMRKTIFVYRPLWDGALVQPKGGRWEEFAGGRLALFQPVDIKLGPDEALYVTGWGKSYGAILEDGRQLNEGRIFRIAPAGAVVRDRISAKREKPLREWNSHELIEDLGSSVAVWSTDAQDELVRRGPEVVPELIGLLEGGKAATALETWALWTLGRMESRDSRLDEWLALKPPILSLNARLQALRIAAHRIRRAGGGAPLPALVFTALADAEPRVRFEAVQAIWQARQKSATEQLWTLVAKEDDRVTFYSAWQALRELSGVEELKQHLRHAKGGVRRAALLALLESEALGGDEVANFIADPDVGMASVAALWQAKQSGNPIIAIDPAPGNFSGGIEVAVVAGIRPAALRWTLDGSEPTAPRPGERTRGSMKLQVKETTTLKVALFVPENGPDGVTRYKKVGPTTERTYTRVESTESSTPVVLEPPEKPLAIADVASLAQERVTAAESTALGQGDFKPLKDPNIAMGKRLFGVAGCANCHRVAGEGQIFGPDLTAMGDKADAKHIVESLINPNAIVSEGFALQMVTTHDGKSHAGILRDETNRVLTLVQADGQPVNIEKAGIAKRESLNQSIMPSFASAMSPTQMANLAAWLLSQRSVAISGSPSSDELAADIKAASAGARLSAEISADRVIVREGSRPVGTYVFSDPKILRPGWQNVHAPSGVQITRPHPPLPPEADDHATMHPGVWFGIGEVNGADFWRNKGKIEHVRFLEEPTARSGTVSFRSANRLIAPGGEELASLELSHRIMRYGDAYLLLMEARLASADQDLVFGDQEEMGVGVRLASALSEKGGGRVTNSDGVVGAKEAWGKVADWCSYLRLRDDRMQGVVFFASPSNQHRSWWHTRDYGVMVANPFGARAQPPIPGGKLRLTRGTPLVLRYAALFLDAPANVPLNLRIHYRALLEDKDFGL